MAEPESPRAHLLIVDDEAAIRNVLHDFLSQTYDCEAVDSAEKALARLAEERFDLIVSDITMERMSGLEMVPHIRDLAPKTIIVMISGQQTIEYAIDAMRAGVFDYIVKPFDLRKVDAVVRRALGHHRLLHGKPRYGNALGEVVNNLRRAIDNEEFVVHYQPQVDIASREILGAEALVRWQHPQLGLLAPTDFVPLAEETGLIAAIGEWVLRTACAQIRTWHDEGLAPLSLAVNVSPRQFQDEGFAQTVMKILTDTGFDPRYLELELTETSIMHDAEFAVKILNRLRQLGVRIAIDDFGTGYSSLGYLKRLPIDRVKFDQSFIRGAAIDPDDAALVMAIMTLAHNLQLRVIAEGIESEEQVTFLRLLRCHEGQGYLFSRPVPAEVFRTFLTAPPKRKPNVVSKSGWQNRESLARAVNE